jgi:hypothetical protein
MDFESIIYNILNEGRPRTVNKDVEDISSDSDDRGRTKTKYFVTLTRVDPKIKVASTNVSEWIYQILSEKDRKQIELLAKQVAEEKITEDDFTELVEDFLWDEKNVELPAGRILSLIKTDPKYSNISFDDVEEGKIYQIKKEIKPGPGGYVITDKQAPKYYIELSVDDKQGEKQKAKKRPETQKSRYLSTLNINPDQEKSYYKNGSVHKIVFNTIRYGRFERSVYTIYRKISENDFKNKNQNSSVQVFITPSDKQEHDQDVYYITIPKKVYDVRRGQDIRYIILLSKTSFNNLSSKEKEKLKIKLVPFEDIIKGIEKTPQLTDDGIKDYLQSNDKKLKAYKKSYSNRVASSDNEKQIKPIDIDFSLLIPGEEEPADTKKDEEFEKNYKAAKTFFIAGKYGEGDNGEFIDVVYKRMLRYYDKWKESKKGNDKKLKQETEDNLIRVVETIIKTAFDKLENEEQVDIFVNDVIKEKLTSDKQMGLYNLIIKTIYDNMKSLRESFLKEAKKEINTYLVTTVANSFYDKAYKSNPDKFKAAPSENEDEKVYKVNLDKDQFEALKSETGQLKGIKRIELYVPSKKDDEKDVKPTFDDPEKGKYPVILNLGGKVEKLQLSPKELMRYVRQSPGSEKLNFKDLEQKVYNFSKKVEPGQGTPIKRSIEIVSTEPISPKARTIYINTDRAEKEREEDQDRKETEKKEREKEKAAKSAIKSSQPEMKSIRWMGRNIRVPANYSKDVLKINMAKPGDDELKEFKYYIVDLSGARDEDSKYPNGRLVRDENGKPLGTNDELEARSVAVQLSKEEGKFFKAYRNLEVKAKRVNLGEELSQEDKKGIEKTKISFKIEADPEKDLDEIHNVEGTVNTAIFNKKEGLVITLDNNSKVVFTNKDTGRYYIKPGTFKVINDVDPKLKTVLEKVFAAPKPETKLESYIRKRIKRALQETELSQYMGVQGPEVKKKRLEEYMKKYEWGFQKSEDPYVRSNGTEKHSIVNKLVHELGDEGVAIFNSYAPKGFEISRPDNLNDLADSPLGSQMARPFEPNTLTMRGGRIAEANEKEIDSMFANNVPMDQQLKNAEKLASEYLNDRTLSQGIRKNPNLIHVEKTILKFIQKASEEGTKKDIDPKSDIMIALQVISDKQMNKYR